MTASLSVCLSCLQKKKRLTFSSSTWGLVAVFIAPGWGSDGEGALAIMGAIGCERLSAVVTILSLWQTGKSDGGDKGGHCLLTAAV
jgi:hypothetical protein